MGVRGVKGIGTLYVGLLLLLAITSTAVYTFYVARSGVQAVREQGMLYEEARFLAEHANVTGGVVELPRAADVIVVDPEGVPHVARGVERLELPWDSGASRIYVAVRGRQRVGAADPAAAAAVAAAALEPRQQAAAPAAPVNASLDCLDSEALSRLAATGLTASITVAPTNEKSFYDTGEMVRWKVGWVSNVSGFFYSSIWLTEPFEVNGETMCGRYQDIPVECGSCIAVDWPPGIREACLDQQQLTLTLTNNIVVKLAYSTEGSLRHDIYVEAPPGSLAHTRLELVIPPLGSAPGLHPPVRVDTSGVARSTCGTGPVVAYLDVERYAVLQLNTTLLPVQPQPSSGGIVTR